MNKNMRYVLIGLIILGFILGLNRAWQKNSFEKENRQVELAMSLEEVKVMAGRSGVNLPDALLKLKNEAQVTSLAVSENTLATLAKSGQLSYYLGSDVLRDVRGGKKSPILENIKSDDSFDPYNTYIFFEDDNVKTQVLTIFKKEFKQKQIKQINTNVWEVKGDEEEINNIGLGFSKQEIKLCQKYGFGFIPRLKHNDRFNEEVLKFKFKEIKDIKLASTIIFGGKKISGFPKNIDLVAEAIKKYELNFGFVEFAEQAGDVNLYKSLPNNSLKVHSISAEEMEIYTPERALERYIRAVRERQIKILVIHPFLAYDFNGDLFSANLETIRELKKSLISLGFSINQINKINFNNLKPLTSFEILIFIIAISSAFIFLIGRFGFEKSIWLWLVFILAIVVFILFTAAGQDLLLRKLAALSCAIIFPVLAVVSVFKKDGNGKVTLRKLIPKAIGYLLSIFVITFIGAIIITGLLSDEYFLSGSQRFVGVKVAFLLPLLLIAAYYFLKSIKGQLFYIEFKRIMGSSLLKGEVVLGLSAVLFLIIYILRSGNYIVLPFAGIEESFRNLLDKLLLVRPRTKEIFIGFPFLFLTFIYYPSRIKKQALWFFQCLGIIGLISLINTFCHIHSPVAISVFRSINGLMVGLVIGFVYLVLVELYLYVEKLCSRPDGRGKNN